MPEENIYAPPSADLDNELNTKYLKLDGYSENCMLLCNEYFKSPKICIKTGEDLRKSESEPPTKLVVGRFLPSIKDSFLVQGAWFIRVVLFSFIVFAIYNISTEYQNFLEGSVILPLFILLYIVHQLLNFSSSTVVKIPLYLSPAFKKKRRRLFSFWISLLTVSTFIISVSGASKEPIPAVIIISVICAFLALAVIIYSLPILRLKIRRGDYYYIDGAHPHFLAAIPLRK